MGLRAVLARISLPRMLASVALSPSPTLARCAAAIRLRPAADILRRFAGFPPRAVDSSRDGAYLALEYCDAGHSGQARFLR